MASIPDAPGELPAGAALRGEAWRGLHVPGDIDRPRRARRQRPTLADWADAVLMVAAVLVGLGLIVVGLFFLVSLLLWFPFDRRPLVDYVLGVLSYIVALIIQAALLVVFVRARRR